MRDLTRLDVSAAGGALRRGEVSALELTRAYLARIAETEPALNAYVTVDAEGAVEAADRMDRELSAGKDRGPLHGIPVGVKDLIDTAGLRTTYGSGRYREHVPDRDSDVVQRLREAGAVILGKHATHEFAWGGRTDGRHFGPTRNPHDPSRVPGGSSGGGAASVAARSCLLAIGTDTAGSVRIPAAFCGCVGFKPSHGWASLEGVHPLAPSLDHLGLMGRTAADVRSVFDVLGRHDSGDGTAPTRRERRIGVLGGRSLAGLDEVVRDAFDRSVRALEDAGVQLVPVDDELVDDRVEAILTLVRDEAEQVHRQAFAETPSSFGDDLAELLRLGPVTDQGRRDAQAVVRAACDELDRSWQRCDVVLGPTVPVTAPRIGELFRDVGGERVPIELVLTRLTSVADAAGLPALSLPAATRGLPVGLHLMAPSGADTRLLAAATEITTICALGA
ncbi:MAG: Aspartyl-tRNA(Asn)/glutamyl-tRNA(Gln) amidotransferase subunit [Aeromicrobium sp.]|nr:Aspartyl-tRNA(Asn)/glutamyl-tRNA(Gln) amidotransferase subunit [Aeromicrobium sp.]